MKSESRVIFLIIISLLLSSCGSGEIIPAHTQANSPSARITATLLSQETGQPVTSLPELKLTCQKAVGGSGTPQFLYASEFDKASGKVVITVTFARANVTGYEGCFLTTVNCAPADANGSELAQNAQPIASLQAGQTVELGEVKLAYCQ
jgi:hypothetical protein